MRNRGRPYWRGFESLNCTRGRVAIKAVLAIATHCSKGARRAGFSNRAARLPSFPKGARLVPGRRIARDCSALPGRICVNVPSPMTADKLREIFARIVAFHSLKSLALCCGRARAIRGRSGIAPNAIPQGARGWRAALSRPPRLWVTDPGNIRSPVLPRTIQRRSADRTSWRHRASRIDRPYRPPPPAP